MKIHALTLLSIPAVLPLLALRAAPAAAAPAPPARSARVPDERAKFRSDFKQAQAIGAHEQMARLVKDNDEYAVEWVLEVAERIAERPSDELYEAIAALRGAWREGIKTDFVDEMEKYFSLLDPTDKRERNEKLKPTYDKTARSYETAASEKDGPALALAGNTFEGLAEGFEAINDKYYASQCWLYVASCFDETLRGPKADLYRACRGYKRCMLLREEIGLKDRSYLTTKPRYDTLKGLGYDGEAKAGNGDGPPTSPAGPSGAGAVITATCTYEAVENIDDFERPNYYLDDLYPMWNSLGLGTKGSQVGFLRQENQMTVLRIGSSEVMIDTDGDGTGDVEIPLTGNLEPVEVTLGKGEEQRPWSFHAVVGVEQDLYQNIQMNLQIVDQLCTIYIVPSGSMKTQIEGTPVQIFDDNMDGVYGSPVQLYGHIGLTADHFQPEMDSIAIGGEKRARPWSEYQKFGEKWYKLEVEAGGNRVLAHPVELPTGFLKLKFKGGKPSWVVVKGENDYANSYFDLVGGGANGVEVPVGRYTLFYGELRSGKKRQMVKSLILPGTNTPKWDVDAGQEIPVELGAPFGFAFQYEIAGRTLLLEGDSVVVTGMASERYERPWNCVPRPEVAYREPGSKRGSKPESTKLIGSQEEMSEPGMSWKNTWFPLDLTIEMKADLAEVEVQLTEKKHKLFGKIESEWK